MGKERRRKLKNRASAKRSRDMIQERMQNQERGMVQDQDVQGSFPGKFEDIGLDDPALMSIGIDALQAIFQERAVEEHRIKEIKDWRRKLKNRAAAARSREMQERRLQGQLQERRLQEQLQNEERGIQDIEDGLAALQESGLDNKALIDRSMDELNAIFQERALGQQRISEIKERRRKLKNRAAAARSRDAQERRLQGQLQERRLQG